MAEVFFGREDVRCDGEGVNFAFLSLNVISSGLALFVALMWKEAFSTMITHWEKKKEDRQQDKAKVNRTFLVAGISTIVALLLIYGMFRLYRWYNCRGYGRSGAQT